MTERELKKLNKNQLLELLKEQTERANRIEIEFEEVKRKLKERKLMEEHAGSIAEAALKLNGVFEAAQEAADQYLENIERISAQQDMATKKIEEEARAKAEKMLQETERRCKEREEEEKKKLEEIANQLKQMYDQKKALDAIFKDFSSEKAAE